MKFNQAMDHAVAFLKSAEFKARLLEEDASMLRQLPVLQRINEQGFITTNSQAGKRFEGKNYKTGKPYEEVERSYLEGFMLEPVAIDFIKSMALTTDKNAAFIPVCDAQMPSALDIPLTVVRRPGEETVVETHFSTALPRSIFEAYKKHVKLNKSEKVVYVFCWDTQWGREGLFRDVLRVLKTVRALRDGVF
jgi:hypothetical protein